MKKEILLLTALFTFFIIGCQNKQKKQVHKEINIEKKKINDSVIKATITTTLKQGDKITEEVQVIKGTPGEINAQLEKYKHKTLHTESGLMKEKLVLKDIKEEKVLHFSLNAKSDSQTSGMATIIETDGKVTLDVKIDGLTPGIHAIHLHEKADCSSADGKSTGGHWNPTFEPHGAWGDQSGFHRGDIGNFVADKNGHGQLSFSTQLWCIGCDDQTKNILGKAIIVHQGEDDLKSQPSGAAGARISCAGLIK